MGTLLVPHRVADFAPVSGVRIALSELTGAVAGIVRPPQLTERLDRDHLALLRECSFGETLLMLAGERQCAPRIAPQRRLGGLQQLRL